MTALPNSFAGALNPQQDQGCQAQQSNGLAARQKECKERKAHGNQAENSAQSTHPSPLASAAVISRLTHAARAMGDRRLSCSRGAAAGRNQGQALLVRFAAGWRLDLASMPR